MAFGHQKVESRRLLLREISQRGPVPRIDLAEHTGISRATVTSVTADLLRGGLIEEVPRESRADESARGRPRVDLKIAGAAHLIAGLKVSNDAMSLVLLDFDGVDVAHHECDIPTGRLPPDILAQHIQSGLTDLAQKAGRTLRDISAVGVGLAGVVDAQHGLVYWSPSLNARNVPFGDVLQDHLGIAVYLDNDANLVAMAEMTFGLGKAHSDFIVITIESGVGMGMVLGGQLYRGTRGCGAEFGHTKVHLDGALCRCGQRGCLEAYIADYALVREASSVGGMSLTTPTSQAVATVLTAAKSGDPTARKVVDRASKMFAMGLANLVNIFDPELVILAGEQMQFDHLYADTVIEEMRKSIVEIDKPAPDVVVHKWDNLMWARGAAAYALEFVQDTAVEALEDA
ncbi:ROK family protein [Tateyamaria omphalii]|uniref:ROK family transcriptional regulator n=1 Tax=Tateyamaria omphalii TaxID=299262 RepID=UPI001C9A28DB|nr:ROK family transcriptional regulator [Tateyamaria omphalii]MBY5935305.1 ROK family protein [Tateyamaria omphalii]